MSKLLISLTEVLEVYQNLLKIMTHKSQCAPNIPYLTYATFPNL